MALLKFKPFDNSTWGKGNMICLPESSFPDEYQVGFVVGFGLRFQRNCRTNGGGPEIYKQCASGKG